MTNGPSPGETVHGELGGISLWVGREGEKAQNAKCPTGAWLIPE